MRKVITNNQGVSLIEIIAAMLLVSIILLSYFTFFTQSAKHTQYNKVKLGAVDIAEKVVSDIRNIHSLSELEVKGFRLEKGVYINNQNFPGHEVKITIKDNKVASVLNVIRITVTSTSAEDLPGSSFTTEMYINIRGSST